MPFAPIAPALIPAFLGCVAAALVTGCEKKIAADNIDHTNKLQESAQQRKSRWPGINEGMTEKEVESVLGQPTQRRTGQPVTINQPIEVQTVTYVYEQDGQSIELSFLDGKLQGKVPQFGETVDAKAPLKMSKPAAPTATTAPESSEGAISVDAGGNKASDDLHSREFKRALLEKIKREEAAIKALQGKDEPKKEQP